MELTTRLGDDIRNEYEYAPLTGLIRRYDGGKVTTFIEKTGYTRISLFGIVRPITNVIWYLETGYLITKGEVIDHIDHNRSNNKWENLRLITQAENNRNQTIAKNNKSGHTGVIWNKTSNKWQAQISINRKAKHLGLFDTKEEAISARKRANIKYDFHENHGALKEDLPLTKKKSK